MNIVHRYLERCVWSLLFTLALSFMLRLYASELNFIDMQNKTVINQGDGVITKNRAFDETMRNDVSYDELIGILMNTFETDICINDNYIKASTYSPYLFDFSTIQQSDFYKKQYVYDSTGEVIYIDYSSY